MPRATETINVSKSSEVSTFSSGKEKVNGVEVGSRVGLDIVDEVCVRVLVAVGDGSMVGNAKGLAAAVSFNQTQSLSKDDSDLDTKGT